MSCSLNSFSMTSRWSFVRLTHGHQLQSVLQQSYLLEMGAEVIVTRHLGEFSASADVLHPDPPSGQVCMKLGRHQSYSGLGQRLDDHFNPKTRAMGILCWIKSTMSKHNLSNEALIERTVQNVCTATRIGRKKKGKASKQEKLCVSIYQ